MSDLFPYDQLPTPTVPDLSDQIECTTELIGRGGYGSVYKGRWLGAAANTNPIIAIKIIDLVPLKDEVRRKRRVKLITRELSLWCSIQHENILPLLGIALINGDTNVPAFVCPWMENGNAKEFCSRNPNFPPIIILYDIINGLHYLHTFEPGIVHGDIKAVNVLINSHCEACLCDFGLSRFSIDNTLWKTTATSAGGSARWMAPELIDGGASTPTKESDIYGYGMTCYEILSGNVPFKSVSNEIALAIKIMKGGRPDRESFHSDFTWDIITRCWEQEPKDRPTTDIVLGLLRAKDDDTPTQLSESSKDPPQSSVVQLDAKARGTSVPHSTTNKQTGSPPMGIDDVVSVNDHEAFAAKYLPDLGHDVKDFKVYNWRLTNWKKLEKKLTSPEFDCGGHKWCILLFPFGNSNTPPNDTVSVYLDYADPKRAPEGWHACTQFALVISNIYDPTIYTVSHAQHRFVAEECDWGFTHFTELRKLFNVQEGNTQPTIEDESADITVYVRVLEDPTGVLWHNFVNYDSKKETGCVGLKNQGATGYMNSLLQSLFYTNYFRKAVYQIPTEDEIPTESVALALQRVFYHLQTSDQPVGTTELTKSFGWKTHDSSLQHDVQEFNRVLQDKLESNMKGTKAEGAIAKLFVGKMKSYIKCVNVDYESSRIEQFNDIQLNVKGMKNLIDSFRDYVAVETLEGENKYHGEGYGLQDAKKGIIFQSFPPVLQLQLKRFEYDIQRDAMVKINDRHEFPFEIDLDEFLDPTADRSQSRVYRLFGVLVHSGDLHNGHYFALIKPDKDARWLKFDNDRVTPVTDKEVLEENFGGEPQNELHPALQGNQGRSMKRFTNSYMLVYIRESAVDEVLSPFMDDDTPVHLKRRLMEERLQLEAKKREREEQHLFLTVKVITDETFAKHEGFDLASFDERNWPPSDLPSFRVLKQATYRGFKSRVAQHFGYPENQIRLWVLVNRQNKTVRLDAHIPENEPTLTVEVIRNNMAARQNDLRLYLEVIPDPTKPDRPPQSIMIFLKHFETFRQTLYGIGKTYVPRASKVRDLMPIINERMRWTPGTPLKLFEEIKPGMIELMKPKFSFAQSEIQDGDIICFQVDLPEKETHDLESQGLYSNPLLYYDFLQNRVMIIFKPKYDEVDQDHPEFKQVLSKKQNYDLMAAKVGEYLRHDPIKLRFTTTQPSNGTPKFILKQSLNQSIAEIMAPSYINPSTTVILYEKLDVSIIELETKRSLKVTWTGVHNKEEATYPFLLPKTSSVHDLAEHLAKKATLTQGGTGKIRIFEISKDGKMQKEFTGSEMIGNIPDPVDLYAEEISREEMEADYSDKVIGVFHFSKDLSRTHGVPFKFVVKRGEKFFDTKKRLQGRLGLSDKEIAKYRFALIQVSTSKQASYIEEYDAIYEHHFAPEDVLGLDHVDQSGKSRSAGEKAIVIRG